MVIYIELVDEIVLGEISLGEIELILFALGEIFMYLSNTEGFFGGLPGRQPLQVVRAARPDLPQDGSGAASQDLIRDRESADREGGGGGPEEGRVEDGAAEVDERLRRQSERFSAISTGSKTLVFSAFDF
jgi:hypothetical protein